MKRPPLVASTAMLIASALIAHALLVKVVPAAVFYTWPVAVPCLLLGLAITVWRWRTHRREGFPLRSGLLMAFTYLILPFAVATLFWLVAAKSLP